MKGFRVVRSAAIAVAMMAGATRAQPVTSPATAPATVPSTAPATQPVGSLDTPRDAVKWFAAALRDGDVARLRAVVLTANPAEDHMVTAVGEMAAALGDLRRSVTAGFGAAEVGRFTDDAPAQFQETLARIDAAELVVAGDAATLRYAEAKDQPFQLRRKDGAWRVLADQFSRGADAAELDRRVAELMVQKRVVAELSAEIAAGKHKSAEAAALAWRTKMMSALGAPASAPQSRPATQGG